MTFLLLLAPLCLFSALLIFHYTLHHTAPGYTPPSGERAAVYARAKRQIILFPIIHKQLFILAHHIDPFIPRSFKAQMSPKLKQAGMPLALTSSEFMAGIVYCTFFLGLLGSLGSFAISDEFLVEWILGTIVGIVLPLSKLDNHIHLRKRQILHALPGAVDLIALCMRAGQHFQGALQAVSNQMNPKHPLRTEFELMVANIALGASRQEAISQMATRIGTIEIKRFVQGVLRAEQKGSSLADIFCIQAEIMRTQRTQTAEQAASRASVLMLGPLMLIFLAVFLLLLGPFIVKAYYGTLV
jgi:tight adherence protein C